MSILKQVKAMNAFQSKLLRLVCHTFCLTFSIKLILMKVLASQNIPFVVFEYIQVPNLNFFFPSRKQERIHGFASEYCGRVELFRDFLREVPGE